MTKFGHRSTADEVLAELDISGQLILVPGCATGVGFESMRALAAQGAHVVGTARSVQRAEEACDKVEGRTTAVACEQGDFESVAAAVKTLRAMNLAFDAIIANAGIMAPP